MIRYKNIKNKVEILVDDDVNITGTNWEKVEAAAPADSTSSDSGDDMAPEAKNKPEKAPKNNNK